MKKYLKEVVLIIIEIFLLYVFPLFSGPTDAMGMVVIIILGTFINSFLMGLSKCKYKYGYPIFIALIFLPTILIHYNSSAIVHSVWYLIDSFIGIMLGSIIKRFTKGKEV